MTFRSLAEIVTPIIERISVQREQSKLSPGTDCIVIEAATFQEAQRAFERETERLGWVSPPIGPERKPDGRWIVYARVPRRENVGV